MDERQKWRLARLALDTIGPTHGYMLGGSMALRAHGITDRPIDDINLFTLPYNDGAAARIELIDAIEDEGFRVGAIGLQPSNEHVSHLAVVDPQQRQAGPVMISLTEMVMRYHPADIDGLPVMAVEDCVQGKAEVIGVRTEARDFVDLHHMDMALGAGFVDEQVEALIETRQDATHFVLKLREVAELPGDSFAQYGLTPYQTAELRHSFLAWADSISPGFANPLPMSSEGAAAGLHAVEPEQATAAWARILDHHPASMLSDYEVWSGVTRAEEYADAATTAAEDAEAAAASPAFADDVLADLTAVRLRDHAESAINELFTLRAELNRREDLSVPDREAEVVVRRTIKGLADAGASAIEQEAVTERVTAPAPHQTQSPPFQQDAYAPPTPDAPPDDASWSL
ncbi:hypothetical protein GCM10010411_76150 [Actinomadura fulvescens]|uniref:Nucleotidyl transferase AbiEii/AbiGii toxin family protein n=1 Tax=Actinomadura fulvescens TaxID=46160 RepID=A0ABN3QKF5_9ACTN